MSGGLGGARNAGVDDRDRRDAEQLQTDATREADSYAALQRKARTIERCTLCSRANS